MYKFNKQLKLFLNKKISNEVKKILINFEKFGFIPFLGNFYNKEHFSLEWPFFVIFMFFHLLKQSLIIVRFPEKRGEFSLILPCHFIQFGGGVCFSEHIFSSIFSV